MQLSFSRSPITRSFGTSVGEKRTNSAAHCTNRFTKSTFTHGKVSLVRQQVLKPCQAAEQATFQVADLPADTAAAWQECADFLEQLGLEADKIEKTITKAFGWSGQGYWYGKKEKETPSVENIKAVLDYMTSIGISSEADQVAVISKFPEVIGLEVELMESNVAKLQSAFFLKGPGLTGALKRKPRALGVIVDCEGSCQGMCSRCFAHF